tara:strand:- start:744 stop:1184 length:441 start_codon:yes stop_codon:yes gene_type:complete
MVTQPDRILFACTWNAVRSPIAEALMKSLCGRRVLIDSVGVRMGEIDPFAIAVMQELGIDISLHQSKTFEDLSSSNFDMVISLSPEAQHKAMEMTRTTECKVEFWHTMDPSIIEGSREVRLDAFRQIRDELSKKLLTRFSNPAPVI